MTAGLLAAASANPNPVSGHVQINLDATMSGNNSIGGGAFLNFMKCLRSTLGSGDDPSKLDNFGYPVTALTSAFGGQITFPTGFQNSGIQWVIKNTGSRSVAFFFNAQLNLVSSSGAVTVTGGSNSTMTVKFTGVGRVVFTFASLSTPMSCTLPAGNFYAAGTGDLVLVRATDEAALTAGAYFTPEYITFMGQTNPRTIRAMPWINGIGANYTNEVQWNYRTTPGCLSWFNGRFPNGTWAGTMSGGDAYSVGAAPDTPTSWTGGMVVQATINATNTTTTPSLSITGISGSKTIVANTGNAIGIGAMVGGTIGTFIYDDLLDVVIYAGSSGITPSVPIEVPVALANTIDANLWVPFPAMANDSYVSSLSSFVRDNLFSALTAYFEGPNEQWNFAFPLTTWANNRGLALGFPNANNEPYHGWYALRCCQMFNNIIALWGSRGNLKCVAAFQAFGNTDATKKYRLECFDLNTSLGYTKYNSYVGVSYNSFPNRLVDIIKVLAYASYHSGAQCANGDGNYKNVGGIGLTTEGPAGWTSGLLGAADALAAGGATNIANAIAFLDWDIRQGTNNGIAGTQTLLALNSGANIGSGGAIGVYPSWEAVAASYDGARPAGMPNLVVEEYEAAPEMVAPSVSECATLGIDPSYGGTGGKIDSLITAWKNSLVGFATMQARLSQFKAQSHSLTPSQFVICGPSQWDVLPGDIFSVPTQLYNALVDFSG